MKKGFVILLVLCFASCLKAQQAFKVNMPEIKIEGSLYNKINWIDSRIDTTNLGVVQLGMFNNRAKVVWENPFSDQLDSLMHIITSNDAKNGELRFR